jgi:hypothetical protein
MNFKPEYYFLYTVLSVFAAILISFLYYKKTNLSAPFKVLLISLRAIGLFLVLILFFISFITVSEKNTDKPLNIYLLDNSLSMTLENRQDELKKSVEIINSLRNDISENKIFTFSSDLGSEVESGNLAVIRPDSGNNYSTNLSKSINSISKKYGDRKISSLNIFSDGILDEGGNPESEVLQTNAVINYKLLGDTVQKNDLSVKNVFFNKTVYAGLNTNILVEFKSYNYTRSINLKLYEDEILIQTKEIYVSKEKSLYNYSFKIKSGTEGIKKYRVELENLPDELTNKNNSEEFFIDFISNKFKILVISGNPSPDFAYLTEELKSINNFDVRFFSQKSAGVFYEGQLPALDEFNILILINYPNTFSDFNQLNKVSDDLKLLKLPVLFISGSNTDYEKIKILTDYLPFSTISNSGGEGKSRVRQVEDSSPDLFNYFSFGNSINNLPEVSIPGINFTLRPGSKTILFSDKLSRPVFVISENEERRSAAFFAYNFFKWRLNNFSNDYNNFLGKIINGAVLNTGNKENDKIISFKTDKQVYSPGERIKISGSVNSAASKNKNVIKIQIYNNNYSKDINNVITSGSVFSGETEISEKGEYFVKCILFQNGSEAGLDVNKILIKESELEYKETKADNGILSTIKNLTGGLRISDQNSEEIKNLILKKNEKDLEYRNKTAKIFLNSSLPILLLLIILFSIEWFFRKRLNLP